MYYLTCTDSDNSDTQNVVIRNDSSDTSADIRLAQIGPFQCEDSIKYVLESLKNGDIDFMRYILDRTNCDEILSDLGINYENIKYIK